ncbi:cerebellin 9 isoform X1 [Danio rerio]|uniref:Cerebellin 9 isoform X1 n=1 Tax=Danio rerio TaxID=7955 RepID=A0AB32TZJ7_DANRE
MLLFITILMFNVWTTMAASLFSPNINIIEELEKFKIMETKIKSMEQKIEQLKAENAGRVKVAFSTSLSDSSGMIYIGPFAQETDLVYNKVFTNIGNAYDCDTGIFTAPVKGVYFFNLVLFTNDAVSAGVKLLRNGKLVIAVTDNPPAKNGDYEDTASNSVSLLLEEGDQISLKLLENRRIYTDGFKRNTFSGHLLFTI